MRAQLGGVAREIVGLAGIVGERVIARGAVQAAFNRVLHVLAGRRGCLAVRGGS